MSETTAAVETSSKTYLIAEEYLPKLTGKLDKLVRKAQKLGTTTIAYRVGATKDLPYRAAGDQMSRLEKQEDIDAARKDGKLVFVRFHEVEVTGTTPRLAGWSFVATLQHLTDEEGRVVNTLRTVPGHEGDLPTQFRNASPENCDHCRKVIRTRLETFIVRHEDGTWKQVGRNCTQDFLGGKNPHAVASALELLLRTFEECSMDEGLGGFGGGGYYRYDIEQFLGVVAMLVRIDGWCSRSKARLSEALTATANNALYYLNPPKDRSAYEQWRQWMSEHPVIDEDRETAAKALDYARNDLADKGDARNDYEHNLYVATCQASIDYSLAGIAASLVPYYIREIERRAMKEAELRLVRDSQFMGTVDEKLTLTDVLVSKVIVIDSQFGRKYLHKLITTEGNSVVWFNSGNVENNLNLGEKLVIRGTVKAHEEYQGVKQTTLIRVKVMAAEELEAERAKADRKAAREAKKAAKAAKETQKAADALPAAESPADPT